MRHEVRDGVWVSTFHEPDERRLLGLDTPRDDGICDVEESLGMDLYPSWFWRRRRHFFPPSQRDD